MKDSKQARRLDMAITWAEDARRAALRRVRAAGNPRNPTQAREGFDEEFHAGKKDAFGLELVLIELKARRRQARTGEAVRFADQALDVLVGVGLCLLGALGVAAALVTLGAPELSTSTAAVVGVGYIVVRDILQRRARK